MCSWNHYLGFFLLVGTALAGPVPVAHYLFEGNYLDSSGNNHHAIEAGCWHSFNGDSHPNADLLGTDPQRGGVYRYSRPTEIHYDLFFGGNAANSRLELFANSPFPPVPANAGITLSIWVKRDAVHYYPNTAVAEFSPVFQIGTCGNAPVATLAMEADGRLTGFIEGSNPATHDQVYATSEHHVPANQWHHIAVVFDRLNNRATFYLDGLPQASPVDISAVGDGEMTFDRGILANLCDRTQAFCGELDDARVFYEALTDLEIGDLFGDHTPPQLSAFNTDSSLVGAGENATLTWDATGLSGLSISPGGPLNIKSRSLTVSPPTTTTYTLTATNGSARVDRKITIVVDEAPKLVRFSVNQININEGGSATLQWDIAGTDQVNILPGIGIVPARGTTTVSPSATTKYLLRASNANGTSQHQVTVFVNPPSATRYLVDLGGDDSKAGRPGRPADDGYYWNHLNDWHSGKILSLVTDEGITDGPVALTITDPFTQLSPAAVPGMKAYHEAASSDGFFTDAIFSDGRAEITLTGLDTGGRTFYRLGFFASSPAISEVDLRQRYTVRGLDVHSLDYDPTDNTSTTASLGHLRPNADGTLVISLEPFPDAPNAIVAGLGVLEINATPGQEEIQGVKVTHTLSGAEITWPESPGSDYAILRSTDQKTWHQISAKARPPHLDSSPPPGRAFYQIHQNP